MKETASITLLASIIILAPGLAVKQKRSIPVIVVDHVNEKPAE